MSESSESPNLNSVKPEWIKQLLYDSECEESETFGLKLLKQGGRSVVWNMAITLGYRKKGIPGQACRLLERYFYFLFRSYAERPTGALRDAIVENMKSRIMLLIACCVQLAVKMSSAEARISPRIIRVALLCKGITCTVKEIIQAEAEVFAVIGYRVPLRTSVDVAEQLAVEVGMSSGLVKAISIIMDLAEYQRNDIERKMRWAATGSTSTPGCVRTLHLCAGAVAAAATFYPVAMATTDAATCVVQLANIVNSPPAYISCIADVIISQILSAA
ncbi:uncharacterized protein LOC116777756 [Danaus plexippus]|uniref:Uncharacterized protein n=1 Tax=Danaus plexippus plexippus TaxID=278856 RepID=A0A212EQK2_DANPL|nr:uncharacterized protein LOC116777756 [Danaus plexippus]OWR43734.1 hypothetical protein KGM_203314 [Danaus plexippus plexippus]